MFSNIFDMMLFKGVDLIISGTANPGGTQKPDNPLMGIRNPIPQDLDNPLKGIRDLVQSGTRSQWLRGLTMPT